MPLLFTWLAVTIVMMVLIGVRRVWESRERDWLPISAPRVTEQIQSQQQIEKKVHVLTPVLHWVEGLDVLLLLLVAAAWIYNGLYVAK